MKTAVLIIGGVLIALALASWFGSDLAVRLFVTRS